MGDLSAIAGAIEEHIGEYRESGGMVPPGWHEAVITEREAKAPASGDGMMLVLTFETKSGNVKTWINYQHSNPKTVSIAMGTLAKLSQCLGLKSIPDDSKAFLGRKIKIKVEHQEDKIKKRDDGTPMTNVKIVGYDVAGIIAGASTTSAGKKSAW